MSWVSAAVGAAGVGASLYNGSKSKGGQTGYDVVQLPQYGWTEKNQQNTSDYLNSELQRVQSGQLPAYYQNALPGMQEAMQRRLRKTYFGGPTDSGLYNHALEAGAVMGVGPKAGFAQAQKVSQDYADQSRQIDEYLQQQGVGLQQQAASSIPMQLAGLPQGPQSQIVTYGGTSAPGAGSAMGNIGSILGQIPWGSMGNSSAAGSPSFSGGSPYQQSSYGLTGALGPQGNAFSSFGR